MAAEVGTAAFPWAKAWLGPPAGPADSWSVYNGSLYMNFLPEIRDKWMSGVEAYIRTANERWSQWYGRLEAGPFNTDCLSPVCKQTPQKIPPDPEPQPPSPAPPLPSCGVSSKCLTAMQPCGRGQGSVCVACLGVKNKELMAAGCPKNPVKVFSATNCFCKAHSLEHLVQI